MLVLDATPIEAMVDDLTKLHQRLPDIGAEVRLPESVTVVQYAGRTNGHGVLREERHLRAVLAEVAAERERFPAPSSGEAVICFRAHRERFVGLGFAEEQVLRFGGVRRLNALAQVERLHVVGRPMPPSDDLHFVAQVIHHDEAPVARYLVLTARSFGGQPYEMDVVDFADPRAAALLKATRDDEIVQVLHRARLLDLEEQQSMAGLGLGNRSRVRLVLHHGHVIPGLRVDELHLESERTDVNERRREEAEQRVLAAVQDLQRRGADVTVTAVARAAGAHKQTVAKVLGTPVHTLRRDLSNKGMNRLPKIEEVGCPLSRATPLGVSAAGRVRPRPLSRRLRQACAA